MAVQTKPKSVQANVAQSGDKKVTRVVRRVVKKVDKDVSPQAETPAVEDTPALSETPVTETPTVETPGGSRKRRDVTAESVDETFTQLCGQLEAEVTRQRDLKERKSTNAVGVKFLRSTLKQLKQLQADVRKVAKKKRAARQGSNNSGFMKEARISDAMADFLGVPHGTSMSRVECTKQLHAYILKNNLQNPDNRREILADKALCKLLKHNKKSKEEGGDGPLYYFVMQRLIQQHFVKDTPAN